VAYSARHALIRRSAVRPVHILTAIGGLVVALALTSVAAAQDNGPFGGIQPYYWPHRKIGIPVNTDEINKLPNKPTHLQLYYAANRGPFQKGPKLPLNGLDDISITLSEEHLISDFESARPSWKPVTL